MTLLNREHAQELERQVEEFLRLELAILLVMQKVASLDKDFAANYFKSSSAFIQALSSLEVSKLISIRRDGESRSPLLRVCDTEGEAMRFLKDCQKNLPFPLF